MRSQPEGDIAMAMSGRLRSIHLSVTIAFAVGVTTFASGAVAVPRSSEADASGPARGCAQTSRPFGVGSLTLDLVDTTRDRQLPTTVYYPASGSGQGATPACGSFPLIVAGHGSQGTGASAASLHAFLTEAGYVIAAPTLPSGFDFRAMAGDVRFVITKMLAQSAGSGTPLHGLIARKHVGYIGTSMGGMLGLALYQSCCLDPRIDAVVSKIGMAPGGEYAWGEGPPLLMINGDADQTISYDAALEAYHDAHRPKGMITLAGIGHDLNVGNDPILRDAPLGFFAHFLKGRRHGLDKLLAAVETSSIASLQSRW
jgi:dienelactone hydrolase